MQAPHEQHAQAAQERAAAHLFFDGHRLALDLRLLQLLDAAVRQFEALDHERKVFGVARRALCHDPVL
jgi:hypothetical protein